MQNILDITYKNVLYRLIPIKVEAKEWGDIIDYACIIFHPFSSNPIYKGKLFPTQMFETTTLYGTYYATPRKRESLSWGNYKDKHAEMFIDHLVEGMTSHIGKFGGGKDKPRPETYENMKFMDSNTKMPDCVKQDEFGLYYFDENTDDSYAEWLRKFTLKIK